MHKVNCDKDLIGRNMARARANSRMSQVAASFELGRSESTIAKVESGNRLPSIEMLCQYINAFNVDANYLLGIHKENSIDAELNNLDEEVREYLIRIFRKMISEFPER